MFYSIQLFDTIFAEFCLIFTSKWINIISKNTIYTALDTSWSKFYWFDIWSVNLENRVTPNPRMSRTAYLGNRL